MDKRNGPENLERPMAVPSIIVPRRAAIVEMPDGGLAQSTSRHVTKKFVGRDIATVARKYTTEAMETIVSIMRDAKADQMTRLKAAALLLDRGYGKIPQTINMVQHFSADELEDAARKIMKRREAEKLGEGR